MSPPLEWSALLDLSESDRELFALYGLGQRLEPPFGCVHHAFDHYVARHPSALAVDHLGEQISYHDLHRKSSNLARHLRHLGVRPGTRVVLLAQRSIPFVAAILATLKAGGCYVPLDGTIVTDSTLDHVLHDSDAIMVLYMKEYAHRVTGFPSVCLEEALDHANKSETENFEIQDLSSPSDSAYVIYTSGTTGKPKGVDVMHSNVTNLICLPPGNLGMKPGMKVGQFLNIAFDMAQWEILGAMANGCSLFIRGRTSKEWRSVMKMVDIVIATPSIMAPHDPADYPNIKVVATAGEVCPQALADRWAQTCRFHNSCGPTEITIVNTVQLHTAGSNLSIGTPTPNNTVYILDEQMKPVPIGEPGIMWAGGAGISRGYVNLPEKTAERYWLDPFLGNGSIMFNTGDLGRWRPDGQLEHLGRIDDQVKVKGFRVELDGVSAAMQTCSAITGAVALLIGTELWGFVTPAEVEVELVKAATARVQPYYAVPTRYITLESFPHTSNGKIDKRALRRMAETETETSVVLAPRKPELVFVPFTPVLAVSKSSSVTSLAPADGTLWTNLVSQPMPPSPAYVPEFRPFKAQIESHPYFEASPPSHSGLSSSGSSTLDASSESKASSQEKVAPSDISVVEKGEAWKGYLDDVLPPKTQGKRVRNLRHQVFSLYRRLFGVVFLTNLGVFLATVARGHTNAKSLGQIVVANFFCAILMRQDYVVNAFFNVFCAVPTSWPLAIRRVCARVYHIGGLHSGCAISAVLWLILFTVQATIEVTQGTVSIPTLVVTYLILLLLFAILLFAWPSFRQRFHDRFERTHRFLGWTATALVWCQTILLINDYRIPGESLAHALRTSPPFWLVVIMTASIVLPWTRLRKVPVRSEVLSTHAVRLYFDYVTPVPGTYTRISENPLMEWHSFATVPEPGKTGYSLVVSKAGDWTTNQIANPPTKLWVRGIPTCGVLRIVPLFRRLVFVATGSGIGPCAPCILEQRVPIRVLWTSPNVRQTFGDKLVDSLLAASPDAVIYDTRTHGKPDMVKLTMRMVKEFDAEAVCIISNQKLTQKLVYGLTSRGIPAFGAIWDS
ncbi:nonribosomal peptide synthetase 12 [Sistotremastrum suecicum HHB10207 ss-3]|uniref:Nonribosomal peptide synthetase 12 n=1 Tax=Sistotremastrum suecicum HHB10207 ss-3 TaxID=1314776 RepID=A0A166HG07_9AGAM|nr:nonribosomal peptide synthetase 12 [Sistotremastrum suecicum HHB10207 ss-3]